LASALSRILAGLVTATSLWRKTPGRRDKPGDDANTRFSVIEIQRDRNPLWTTAVKINVLHLTGP